MYNHKVSTCLSIFYIVIVAMYFCMYFIFVTFSIFSLGNYSCFGIDKSSNGSSNKVYYLISMLSITSKPKSTINIPLQIF